jgi:menaquinone-dependent protoporphyrinogen IX oxidase
VRSQNLKTAILYYSKTGNTAKIAHALLSVLELNAELYVIRDGFTAHITDCEFIIIGTPIFGCGPVFFQKTWLSCKGNLAM